MFEFDGESAWFYLYATPEDRGHFVMDSLHIFSGALDFSASDVDVRWDKTDTSVGLFINDVLWAAFDCSQRKGHGGNYKLGGHSSVPASLVARF